MGIGIILVLLLISAIGHNMSMVYSCVILLVLKLILPHEALTYVGQHGVNWGIILLTIAMLVPIVEGKIGLPEIRESFTSGMAIMTLAIGLLVAIFGRWGVTLISKDPQISVTLMLGTVLGVIFFKGVAVGPLIAGGITYAVLSILKILGLIH
jgi:uncharacterized membrane protein (DUF441 family)